jgi:hypothetical protein
LAGFIFLWHKPSLSWVPISVGILVLFFSAGGWFYSQKDVDYEASVPTYFADSEGNQLITDTRAFSSPTMVQSLEKIFSGLSHRKPLPDPDGLVDESGTPIPNSKSEAQKRVRDVNMAAQEITDMAIAAFGGSENSMAVEQPLLNEPKSDILIATNYEDNEG